MKKYFASLFILAGMVCSVYAANPTFNTIQISTAEIVVPTLQTGSFRVSSGTITTLRVSTLTPTGIVGTTTNNDANVGNVGENISSTVGATNAPTTAQWGDLTSISLTPGDWSIGCNVVHELNGATITATPEIGISVNTGNNGTGLTYGDSKSSLIIPTATQNSPGSITGFRALTASTTTYYLKMTVSYSAGTPRFSGRISARRVR